MPLLHSLLRLEKCRKKMLNLKLMLKKIRTLRMRYGPPTCHLNTLPNRRLLLSPNIRPRKRQMLMKSQRNLKKRRKKTPRKMVTMTALMRRLAMMMMILKLDLITLPRTRRRLTRRPRRLSRRPLPRRTEYENKISKVLTSPDQRNDHKYLSSLKQLLNNKCI